MPQEVSLTWVSLLKFTAAQWFVDFYPQGKTSIESRLNLPGRYAWLIMELPGMFIVLYLMYTLPSQSHLNITGGASGLPWVNWTMAGLYVIHYIYRAILSPLLLNPSMSPIHFSVFAGAIAFNTINGLCIGGWAAGYGPTSVEDWAGRARWCTVGLVIWGWALLGNMFHDDELREIRREVARRQSRKQDEQNEKTKREGKSAGTAEAKGQTRPKVDKVYMMPKNGLFNLILYPHYLCEFVEWGGFWMVGGLNCVPARTFLLNELSTMIPRAVQGWHWYVKTFGREKVGKRKAIIPYLL